MLEAKWVTIHEKRESGKTWDYVVDKADGPTERSNLKKAGFELHEPSICPLNKRVAKHAGPTSDTQESRHQGLKGQP